MPEYTMPLDPQAPHYLDQVAWLMRHATWWQATFHREGDTRSVDLRYEAEKAMPSPAIEEESGEQQQFAGFARLLYREIQDMACSFETFPGVDVLERRECAIIARRAADLVKHTLSHDGVLRGRYLASHGGMNGAVKSIPDLPAWPERRKE